MQRLEVSCAVGRFFKSLGFKGLSQIRLGFRKNVTELKKCSDFIFSTTFV